MQAGYVYIVHGIGTPYIKVGKTTNLPRRLQRLESGCPFQIRLLFANLVYDMDSLERAMKARYAACKTRGEWFELPANGLAQWPPYVPEPGPPVRIVRPVPLEERIVRLVEQHNELTTRQLQRLLHLSAKQIKEAVTTLTEAEQLITTRLGKSLIISRREVA